MKFRQASNSCKIILEVAQLAYATKSKESSTSEKLGFHNFWQITNSVLNKGKSAISPLFSGPEALFSASDKEKLLKTFLRTLILMTRTYLKLYNIYVTPKMVKIVITNRE